MKARCHALLVVACLASVAVSGEPPQTLEHRGQLPDPNRCPPPIEEHRMRFSLWTEAEAGELRWEEEQLAVKVQDGRYSVELGASTPLELDPAGLWLETEVDGIPAGPRVLIATSDPIAVIEGTLSVRTIEIPSPYGSGWIGDSLGDMYLSVTKGFDLRLKTSYDSSANSHARITVTHTGAVGIGSDIANPVGLLEVAGRTYVSTVSSNPNATLADDTGYLILGQENGPNMVLDRDEIQARNDGVASTLHLNYQGGEVRVNNVVVTSDARLKKDVVELEPGLDEVLKLRPVAFSWTKHDDGRHIGLVAQEAQKVVGEVVSADDDGTLGISYQSLVPVLIKAIQEQQAEIESLSNEVDELRRMISRR
jgi:hypothetical protein